MLITFLIPDAVFLVWGLVTVCCQLLYVLGVLCGFVVICACLLFIWGFLWI